MCITKNIDMQIKDNILTVVVDLTKSFGVSTSGKSIIIASSEGNAEIPGTAGIKIGLNVFQKA